MKNTVHVQITKCIQDSQDFGSNDEHMVSRVFFTITTKERTYENLYIDIKQIVGSNFEDSPLEVFYPKGYKGPFDYDIFREEVEKYYRECVGSKASGIRIAGNSKVRMRNNQFISPYVFEFDAKGPDISW